jgi:hypothetical protein
MRLAGNSLSSGRQCVSVCKMSILVCASLGVLLGFYSLMGYASQQYVIVNPLGREGSMINYNPFPIYEAS